MSCQLLQSDYSVDNVKNQLGWCRSLDGKLEKRRAELDRADKRLSSLAVVRPAYMDEYEVLQAELQQLFGVYLERFR